MRIRSIFSVAVFPFNIPIHAHHASAAPQEVGYQLSVDLGQTKPTGASTGNGQGPPFNIGIGSLRGAETDT